jgi:hypothetical protein
MNLHDNGAEDTSVNYWNNTSPTSSVFSVGASNGTNQDTKTFVAYCFAEIEGYSAFGSYEGNADADGPVSNYGFEAASLLIKDVDSTPNWVWHHPARGNGNTETEILYPNNTAAETAGDALDIYSTSFKPRNTLGGSNAARTHIYCAWGGTPIQGPKPASNTNQGRAR